MNLDKELSPKEQKEAFGKQRQKCGKPSEYNKNRDMAGQNLDTLLALGFTKITSSDSDEYLFRGRHQKFIAKVVTCNGPQYVSLFHVGPICDKPLSPMFGKHYRIVVKDCTSEGSVEKALQEYDLPEESLHRTAFGTQIRPS